MADQFPAFLKEGVFEWDALGYSLPSSSVATLQTTGALHDDNPWIAVCAILLRAKSGTFDQIPRLADYLSRSNQPLLRSACANLIGDAGSQQLIKNLPELFKVELKNAGNFSLQSLICQAFHQSLLLSTVPEMLGIYLSSEVRSETSAIPLYISRLLEPEFGELADASGGDDEYKDLVLAAYEETCDHFGTNNVPILYGEQFSVESLAKRLLLNLRQPAGDDITILRQRHFFEAATGLDCNCFYAKEELQYLAATSVVESFLESPAAAKFKPGVRYFCGHRIPD